MKERKHGRGNPEPRTGLIPDEIRQLRAAFGMSAADLARAMRIQLITVERWERGLVQPAGLPAEVLRALWLLVGEFRGNEAALRRVAGRLSLGIGALIYYGLTSEHANSQAAEAVSILSAKQCPPASLSEAGWHEITLKYPTQSAAVDATGYDPKTIAKYLAKYKIPNPWSRE